MSLFAIKQIQEGSIIFNKEFGVEICGNEGNSNYEFIFKIYCNDELVEEYTKKTKTNKFYFSPICKDDYKSYKVCAQIYVNENKIDELYTNTLDYIEDFISIKEVKLELKENKLIAKVESNLNLQKEEYAYYLDKDNSDAISITWYSKESEHVFPLFGKGNYSVRVFCRIVKNNGYTDSKIIRTNTVIV